MEAPAASEGQPQLVQDFFDTIEEAGLSDIAAEVGLVTGQKGEPTERPPAEAAPPPAQVAQVDQGLAPATASTPAPTEEPMSTQQSAPQSAPESTLDDADADADADDADADDDAPASPARVMVPYSSSGGPQIPPELEGTLGAVGEPASKKKRLQRAHGGKQGDKGLRHFSMKVCEKVEQKGRTTYNEVADELVAEFAALAASEMVSPVDQAYDEKNIRRRVYDALNVLMAMEIITKEKKNILWRGLPTNTQQEGTRMQMDLASRKERLDKKRLHLQELLTQQISFKNLIKRNSASAANGNGAASSSVEGKVEGDRIPLPFIIVNSRKETVIDCEMAEDKQEIFFNFSAPFEIHDDNEVLKRMQMQFCPALSDLGTMVPESLVPFATAWQQQQQQLQQQAQQSQAQPQAQPAEATPQDGQPQMPAAVPAAAT